MLAIPFANYRVSPPAHSIDASDVSEESDAPDKTDPTDEIIDLPETSDPSDSFSPKSELLISAVNPGYKIDGVSDVGELIELRNLTNAPLSLAGFSLRYTNGSGNSTTIISFSNGSLMAGEYLLIRYSKSPNSDAADLIYTTSLAMTAGPIELMYDGDVVDSVCWTGKNDCQKAFKSASPTTLVRNFDTGDFEHLAEYIPHFDPSNPSLILPPEPDGDSSPDNDPNIDTSPATPRCRGLEFTEVYSYYSENQSEQFLELYNPTDEDITMDGCLLRYKKKEYALTGTISSDGYFAYYPGSTFSLTKNPTTSNNLELIDADGQLVDELVYLHGQKKSTAYAKFYDGDGSEMWSQTYLPTPGAANVYQEFRSCPAGKVINPATGNCINDPAASATVQDCPAGKYRNPLTGRCKTIETESILKPCAEGYERNPTTNRCRKIQSENDGADYTLVPTTRSDKTTFVALGVVILLVSLGVIYIILQFRREIARALRKVRQRCDHLRKNLLSREVRRNRNKKT